MLLCLIAVRCLIGCNMDSFDPLTYGIASYYGADFHGRLTACGETYDMHEMSCAHRTLPMGSILRVHYKGRSVEVIVNDRGPYVEGRIIDLSAGSFKCLVGDMDRGLAPIGYEVIGRNIRSTMRYNL